jgi:hypothetical protein
MRMKLVALAAGAALMAGTGIASAATVTGDLNLRAGPGTNYPVIDTMPAGAHVSIRNCTGGWCRVAFRGQTGWASDNFLASGTRTYTTTRTYVRPSYTVVEPGYAYAPDYDYGPYAYEPGFSIGFGIGGFGGHRWHGGGGHWGGGHHWSGGGHWGGGGHRHH